MKPERITLGQRRAVLSLLFLRAFRLRPLPQLSQRPTRLLRWQADLLMVHRSRDHSLGDLYALSRAREIRSHLSPPSLTRFDCRVQTGCTKSIKRSYEAQYLGLIIARFGEVANELRLAFGQCTGLFDDKRIDLLEPLKRLGVLDQHPSR